MLRGNNYFPNFLSMSKCYVFFNQQLMLTCLYFQFSDTVVNKIIQVYAFIFILNQKSRIFLCFSLCLSNISVMT